MQLRKKKVIHNYKNLGKNKWKTLLKHAEAHKNAIHQTKYKKKGKQKRNKMLSCPSIMKQP